MSKRYYWLKLKEDFFDDDTISYIEEQENGVYYVNFYLKLCLKSLKTDGKLIRLVGERLIPYDVNSLAKLTGTPVDTVRVAMTVFENIGLVKVMDSGEIYLSQLEEMIGKETDKAAQMRRKRAEDKISGNNVTKMLPKRYPEKEIEKDTDIELEKEIEKENSYGDKSPKSERLKIDFDKIKEYFNTYCTEFSAIREMTDARKKTIKSFLKNHSESDLYMLFDTAQKSDFLTGNNTNGWTASFDWIIKPANAVKILEGNYNNRAKKEEDNIPETVRGIYQFMKEEEAGNGIETIF